MYVLCCGRGDVTDSVSRAGATSQVGQVSSTFRAAAAIDNMREPLGNRSCVSIAMHDLRYD